MGRKRSVKTASGAEVSVGKSFIGGGSWAGQQLLKALQSGRYDISPESLRTLDTLQKDEWVAFDTALVEAGVIRLRAAADHIAAGNTIPVANGMGKTIFQYELVGDMNPADVSMDGNVMTEDDALNYTLGNLPLPIIHKDWSLNIRTLAASRERGEALDTTQTRVAGRLIGEKLEDMLLNGLSKQYLGFPIYGYTTHPNRNTSGFGTNGDWGQAAKTGENILADVDTMIAALSADRFYGPYHIYVPADAANKIAQDYKAASDKTTLSRILDNPQILSVKVADQLAASNVVMVQPTRDVASIVTGEPMQTIQWDINGGFKIQFKGFTIQVPLVRADSDGRSGVYHMTD
jgi:hypothetical protein